MLKASTSLKTVVLVIVCVIVSTLTSFAPVASKHVQHPDPKSYPQGYFRNPLGIPMTLAANFGELRPNHFHMGFDIRTNQVENMPVFAAASGYVSKVKIEKAGFGRAIYIAHPNGYTTLYAHLNNFYPALNEYVKSKQYEAEQWEQEITFEPSQFPVEKGQFIAYSGNTGGSAGPHLHFEIRDTKTERNYNPALFGFYGSDNIPPFIYRLYWYDRRYSTYQTAPKAISIRGSAGRYASTNDVVGLSSPRLSFGIAAEDKSNTSPFRYGIYAASIAVDDTLRCSFLLNDISYDDTRYINGSIDYKTKMSSGSWIQHLSKLPGNYSTIFNDDGDGVIELYDTLIHSAEILVKDASGNTSTLRFRFRWEPKLTEEMSFTANSISLAPNKENIVSDTDYVAAFSSKAFYDTLPFVHREEPANDTRTVSAIHYLHDYKVPVHDSYSIRLRPTVTIDDNLKDKVVMQLKTYHKRDAVKGSWVNDWYEARFRDFGSVRLLIDTIPPTVRLSGWKNGGVVRGKAMVLMVTDDVGEIKSFKAFVDGQWLMFSRKNDLFIHAFDGRVTPGRHQLRVLAEDIAGNVAERTFTFIR